MTQVESIMLLLVTKNVKISVIYYKYLSIFYFLHNFLGIYFNLIEICSIFSSILISSHICSCSV